MLHNIYLGLCRLIEKIKIKPKKKLCRMEMELDFIFNWSTWFEFLEDKNELKV
jgi:hypothetical protein